MSNIWHLKRSGLISVRVTSYSLLSGKCLVLCPRGTWQKIRHLAQFHMRWKWFTACCATCKKDHSRAYIEYSTGINALSLFASPVVSTQNKLQHTAPVYGGQVFSINELVTEALRLRHLLLILVALSAVVCHVCIVRHRIPIYTCADPLTIHLHCPNFFLDSI